MSSWLLRIPRKQEKQAFEIKSGEVWLDGLPGFRLSEVEEVSLDKVIATQYNLAHYLLRIKVKGKTLAWQAPIGEPEALSEYRGAVLALHEALKNEGRRVKFGSGLRSPALFWAFNIFFGLLFALLEVAIFMGTKRKGNYATGIAAMVAVPLIAWAVLSFASRFIKPRNYSPDRIPNDLIPPAQV